MYVYLLYHFYSTIAIVSAFFSLYSYIISYFSSIFCSFSVFLRISKNHITNSPLTTFVYDTFAQKISGNFRIIPEIRFVMYNYLITTSFHASDGTIAIYVLPTFNTNSSPFASKYCVGLVRLPFLHVISVISPFTR